MAQITSTGPGFASAENLAVALTNAGNTAILELPIPPGLYYAGFQIKPAVRALTAFLVEGKFHPDGAFVTISAAVAVASVQPFAGVSATLTTLGAGSTGWFFLNCKGLVAVRLSATCATDATGTIDAYATGTP